MNRQSAAHLAGEVADAVKQFTQIDVVLCPPAVLIPLVSETIGTSANVSLGAQNMCEHDSGAYTGEIAAEMLKEYSCTYVILGHSERRQLYGETNAMVAAKTVAALNHDLIPIVCIGETLDERESGATDAVVTRQLDAVINEVGAGTFGRAVIAYEPVWAIGTGKTATPDQAQAVHALLRDRLASVNAAADKVRILYGGSVKPDNAAALFEQTDIDGGLIGGASLKSDEFVAICQAAS